MAEAVIAGIARTAVATAYKGSLVLTRPEKLAKTVLDAVIERTGLATELIDDVIMAESLYGGGDVARHAALEAGLVHAGGMALNRHCAGSLSSVAVAASSVMSGMDKAIIAGGVQSSSLSPKVSFTDPDTGETHERWMPPTHPETPDAPCLDMSITVGWNTAVAAGLTREEMDVWAHRSHERAIAAIDAGNFEEEIVPIMARQMDGSEVEFKVDEHARRGLTLEKVASLKPLHPEIEGFSISAGNSSGINDAASAMMVCSAELAAAEGLDVNAKVLGWASRGITPKLTGMAVPDAVNLLLKRTGKSVKDIALWEINEAFASVPIAASRDLGISEDIVNIAGSGCSIGHPVSASGGRMLATLIYDLKRRGGGLGIATMCAGGGQAGAVLIEV